MIALFALVAILVTIGIGAYFLKLVRLREIQKVFREYNDCGDLSVLTGWIERRQRAERLTRVLEYLEKIEHDELSVTVLEAFSADALKGRHLRVFACRALGRAGKKEAAMSLGETLLRDYPGDDAILELYLETALKFKLLKPAKKLLQERLSRKAKGTAFKRQYAQILASEGKFAEAEGLLEEVVRRDRTLYENTFAQPQKRQIYEQYLHAQSLLDEVRTDRGAKTQ